MTVNEFVERFKAGLPDGMQADLIWDRACKSWAVHVEQDDRRWADLVSVLTPEIADRLAQRATAAFQNAG